MTDRLKKKLKELGVETSSHRASESFCLIGTPLPSLEKSRDTGEFVPLWKQDVRDEKGRRRLHGAFTGGFSAGYFNTVGSKEGWTPTNFVSSRNERTKRGPARPEDFMDEEDLQELKDSRVMIDTADEMSLSGETKSDLLMRENSDDLESDSLINALQSTLLPVAKDSGSAQILKKMGWRSGHGIGPRVSLRERKLQDLQALRSSSTARSNLDSLNFPEDDEEAQKHTYARRDTPLLVVERKDNSHGLGYEPGMGLNESLGRSGAGVSKGPNLAAGFGLGALNEADEDDLDVYDGGMGMQRNKARVAYDTVDHQDESMISVGSKGERKSRVQLRSSLSIQTFRNGHPVLSGFVLSNKPVIEDVWFSFPEIPIGWKSDPRRVWAADPNKPMQSAENLDFNNNKRNLGMTADDRGGKLGERPLPSAPRSVFEYISAKDRDRLRNITSSIGSSNQQIQVEVEPALIGIPSTEAHIAQAALRGFQPFPEDPQKQARYTSYLQSQASGESSLSPQRLDRQSFDEYNKELKEYAKFALVFKPMSGAMAGRFTSASIVDFGPKVSEGLYTPSADDIARNEEGLRKEAEDKIRPKAHAANLGMFGPLTRETKPWQPAKLLCKRFGLKEPNPTDVIISHDTSSSGILKGSSGTDSKWRQLHEHVPAGQTDDIAPNTTVFGPRDLNNIGLGEDETQGVDTLSYRRPTMDIFKAIFASDSEDSDEDQKESEETGQEAEEYTTQNTNFQSLISSTLIPTPTILPLSNDTPMNFNTFKPTFIPRPQEHKSQKSTDKKDKKKRRKKGVLVSFDMDEDDSSPEKPQRKKHKMETSIPVDKPVPDIVKNPSQTQTRNSKHSGPETENGQAKERKRAVDFM